MPGTFSPPQRVRDPDMHHGTCVTHAPRCMPGLLTSGFFEVGGGENGPGLPGACATRNFTYLVRVPCQALISFWMLARTSCWKIELSIFCAHDVTAICRGLLYITPVITNTYLLTQHTYRIDMHTDIHINSLWPGNVACNFKTNCHLYVTVEISQILFGFVCRHINKSALVQFFLVPS